MAHSHSIKQYPGQMAGIVAAGAAIGAGVALLFAPKTGADTRKQLKSRIADVKQKMQASKVGEAAEKGAGKMKTTATDVKTSAKSAAREVKSSVKKSTSDSKDMTDEIRRNGEP